MEDITISYRAEGLNEITEQVKELVKAMEKVAELQDRINSTKLEIKVEGNVNENC